MHATQPGLLSTIWPRKSKLRIYSILHLRLSLPFTPLDDLSHFGIPLMLHKRGVHITQVRAALVYAVSQLTVADAYRVLKQPQKLGSFANCFHRLHSAKQFRPHGRP